MTPDPAATWPDEAVEIATQAMLALPRPTEAGDVRDMALAALTALAPILAASVAAAGEAMRASASAVVRARIVSDGRYEDAIRATLATEIEALPTAPDALTAAALRAIAEGLEDE